MAQTPNHVLVLGEQDEAIRMGRSLQQTGVNVSFLKELEPLQDICEPLESTLLKSLGSVDLVLFGVCPDRVFGEAQQLQRLIAGATPVVAVLPGIRRLAWAANAAPRLQWIRCVISEVQGRTPSRLVNEVPSARLYLTYDERLARWRECVGQAGYAMELRTDMQTVQWGQTLMLLASLAVLASGESYQQWLSSRSSRTLLARLWEEALELLLRTGIDPAPMLDIPWRAAPLMLKMSDVPFAWLAKRYFLTTQAELKSLAPKTRDQLELAIDVSCGEVMRLAIGLGDDAPCAVGLAEQLAKVYKANAERAEIASIWELE